jgi:cell division protein FtsI (penicillin-binding protein 3)|tara:strand:- start:43236 stop:44906 length:1671 start_codon:yes stop_codon:yes gene_type:complete
LILDKKNIKNHEQYTTRNRLKYIFVIFVLGYIVLASKLFDLSSFTDNSIKSSSYSNTDNLSRPMIIDRNGYTLAQDIEVPSLAVNPKLLINIEDTIDRLMIAIPGGFNRDTLRKKLSSKASFVWLKRGIEPHQKASIHALGIPGIRFEDETSRYYPYKNTLAHIIGYTNIDNIGQAGMERHIDSNLLKDSNFYQDSKNIQLSIDLKVTHAMRDELIKSLKKYKAIAAAGILMDINNGEVISLVSLPDFDPHVPEISQQPAYINRITNGAYEIGSTFKSFTVAMAMDLGIADLDTMFDARSPLQIGRRTIRDDHPQSRMLSLTEVYTYSSNIGTSRMAIEIGDDRFAQFLKKLGMVGRIKTELPELSSTLLKPKWGQIQLATASFGHGIAITPLHAAAAGASILNGGIYINPTFLKRSSDTNIEMRRTVDSMTSEKVRKLMYLNVINGTAKRAQVEGYHVGGKTGSGEKVENGTYNKDKLLTTFMGVFPIDDPEYILFLLLDEPKRIEETRGQRTAGWNAAPTFSNIVSRIAPMLGVKRSIGPSVFDEELTVASAVN